MLRRLQTICFAIALAVVLPASSSAQHVHSMSAVNFQVSCSPKAQAEFNRAVTLLHHMTYPQARVAFQNVATIDPRCAMAHWGVAMTLFQPLWPTRPNAEARQQAWQEVEIAKSLPSRGRSFLSRPGGERRALALYPKRLNSMRGAARTRAVAQP